MRNKHIIRFSLLPALLLITSLNVEANNKNSEELYSQEVPTPTNYLVEHVNHLTGVPCLSVPLTSISDRDIVVDVNLTYNAEGIKVGQEASTVGLGWILDAGGVIERNARGGIYDTVDNLYTDFTILDFDSSSNELFEKQIYNPNPSREDALELFKSFHNGNVINSPDIFTYNFCGHTGNFYIDNELCGHPFSYEEMKIQMIDNETIVITDDKGFVYSFKGVGDNSPHVHPSTWYLSTITSPQGGKVEFKYIDATYERYDRFCKGYLFEEGFAPINEIDLNSMAMRQKYQCYKYNLQKENLMQLDSIIAGNSTICFVTGNTNRKDCYNGNGVTVRKIVKYNSLGNKVKEYNLKYDYFGIYPNSNNSHKTTIVPTVDDYSSLYYRLKLIGIEEVSPINGASNGTLGFSYYGEDSPYEYHLSSKNGHQDHYGFNNSSMMTPCDFLFPNKSLTEEKDRPAWYRILKGNPDVELQLEESENREFSITGGGYRDLNESFVKSGTLKRITYPEGGWREYDYEAHKAFLVSNGDSINKGGIRVKTIIDNDGYGNEIKREFEYNGYYWYQGFTGDSLSFRYFTVVDPEFTGVYKYVNDFTRGFYTGNNANQEVLLGFDKESTKIIINPYPVPEEFDDGFIYTSVTEKISDGVTHEYKFSCPNREYIIRQIDSICPFYKDNSLFLLYGESEADSSVIIKTISKKGNIGLSDFPYPNNPGCPWAYGDLIEHNVYNANGQLLNSTKYEYDNKLLDAIPSNKIAEMGDGVKFKGIKTIWSGFYCVDYLMSGISLLKKKEILSYSQKGHSPIKSISIYEYNDSLYIDRPTAIHSHIEGGDSLSRFIYYADNYRPANGQIMSSFAKLLDDHIVLPIDIRTTIGGKTIDGKQIEYNKNGQPVSVYTFKKGNPEFITTVPYSFLKATEYEYNDGLLTKERNVITDETIHYVWGYDGQYPCTQVFNYEKIEGKPFIVEDFINGNKTKAFCLSFEYIPDVGISKIKKADGSAEIYEYDEFYRLKKVVRESCNGNRKVVEEYSYSKKE